MVRTKAGYAGGGSINPTYRNLGDHTETIQIEFEAGKISYERLLEIFWQNHAPWERRPVQYMSIIFFHSPEQERAARESLVLQEKSLGRKLVTQIRPYETFYLAEDYHQKYYLQQIPELNSEFITVYPDIKDFVASTVAARVNGYAAGLGTTESLAKEIQEFGLSPVMEKKLTETVSSLNG
ncbi:MAG: peptide-methionine (S)-S-oxide reductase [Dethiobacter sp.]|nr:peptide-methionine (S)-S-oxide reductase [Dethiobacter sp.]